MSNLIIAGFLIIIALGFVWQAGKEEGMKVPPLNIDIHKGGMKINQTNMGWDVIDATRKAKQEEELK